MDQSKWYKKNSTCKFSEKRIFLFFAYIDEKDKKMKIRNRIIQYAYVYEGDWNRISEAIQRQLIFEEKNITEKCITILDEEYPDALRRLRYPPWVL